MSGIKSLARIGTGDIIGNGISAIFWFYLAILISPENFGELHYFISVVGIISFLTLIGSLNTIIVYAAKKIPIQSTFNFISLIGSVFGFIILFLIFDRIDIGFLVIGYVINNLAIGELLGKKEYKGYFKYILIQKSLTPILGLGFFFSFGIDSIIYGLALSYSAFSFRIIKSFKDVKIDFSLFYERKGFIINNYLSAFSNTFHSQVDKIIVMPILGASILGNYSLSLQIITIMMIGTSIFYKYMLPQEASGHNIVKIKKLIIISAISLTLIGFFIIPIILPVIFPQYLDSTDSIRIMSLSLLPVGISKIHTSKFLSIEKGRFILIGVVLSLSIMIPSMILLGIWYGILGVATSFVLATMVQAVFFSIINKKWNRENVTI
jgi:O-antigen/teichoic acid export membrane protein